MDNIINSNLTNFGDIAFQCITLIISIVISYYIIKFIINLINRKKK